LFACLLAVAVSASPLLGEICQNTCAGHRSHSPDGSLVVSHASHGDSTRMHEGHHQSTEPSTTVIGSRSPVVPTCDHADAEFADSRQSSRTVVVKAIVTISVAPMPVPDRRAPAVVISGHCPATFSSAISQLRI
jgi:hypothetical protein